MGGGNIRKALLTKNRSNVFLSTVKRKNFLHPTNFVIFYSNLRYQINFIFKY